MNHLRSLTAVVLAGCSYTDQIGVSDSAAFFPVARVRIDSPSWSGSAPDPSPDDSGSWSRVSMELSATGAAGDLAVQDGDYDRGHYDVRDFTLLARIEAGDDVLDGAILAGVEFGAVDVEVEGPTRDRDLGDGWFGLAVGLEGGVTPVDSLRAYVRVLPFVGFPSASILQAEVGVEWAVVDPVRLVGGYRYWKLQSEGLDIGFGSTSLELTLTGPFAGVVLQF